MKRRDFLLATAIWLPSLRYAEAQQSTPKKRIAVVMASTKVEDVKRDPLARLFDAELRRTGLIEGENVIIDRYSAEGRSDRYESLAREVVATNPDLIWTGGTPMTLRLKAATNTIPVVTMTGDPIRFGIVSNLARPGGNITGVSVDAGVEVWGKRLELLGHAVPGLKRVAFVSTRGGWTGPGGRATEDAAPKLGISLTSVLLNNPYNEAEYRRVLGSVQREQFDGVMISDENEHIPHRVLMAQLIQQNRLPAMYNFRDQAEAGGLMSYSWDVKAAIRRNAEQMAEIVLRGANPAEMPYFQEKTFELVINLKAAKELGIEVPAGLVAGADAVIE
ncbi:ABC transporter substrate-binding protein [Bradyrhizobium lablabi]|uniref:ABC transporter substrate-binding protein n=1 Tax=Bradyrhizobium lablabi TaxID=722472 RepID=UPI001BACBF46|nr:ABC transporter substrate-binding protein [Bradyrhizobium lablabi]MBR1121863.1 ABC transporter substrate-binding protein [Bradyrhizobium lablabi]